MRKIKSDRSTINSMEARRVILAAQGFWGPSIFDQGFKGTRQVLQHLGYVQIDTISIIERAHHHILWSRVPDYRPEFLHRLVQEGKAFEYWGHAASYLPMEDYRFSLPRKRLYAKGESWWFEMTPELRKLRRKVLDRIRREGALSARDFEAPEGH